MAKIFPRRVYAGSSDFSEVFGIKRAVLYPKHNGNSENLSMRLIESVRLAL
jgi:hypothetical protein